VLRRLVAALVLWVGVLGIASPVLACTSMAPAESDCCPQGSPAPCGGDRSAALECCVAAPPAVTASPVAAKAEQLQIEPRSDSRDPVIPPAWLETSNPRGPPSLQFVAPERLSASTDAALTYLHTGRLRL
jgi:hypothetical protein